MYNDITVYIKARLLIAGGIAGYRIKINQEEKEYDIDYTELVEVITDWGINVVESDVKSLDMVLMGNKWYAKDGSDAYSITYEKLVEMIIKDSLIDIKSME